MTLPASPYDGQLGVIHLGSGVTTTDVVLRWNAARSKWVEEREFTAIRSTQQIGVVESQSPMTTKRYLPGSSETPTYAFDALSPNHCDLAMTAGLTMEYCHGGWMAGNGAQAMHVGAYFYQINSGDYNSPNGSGTTAYGTPPTGGQGETSYIASGTATTRIWVESGWATLLAVGGGALSLTKTFIYPAMYAYMDASASTSGTVWDYFLKVRWVY